MYTSLASLFTDIVSALNTVDVAMKVSFLRLLPETGVRLASP